MRGPAQQRPTAAVAADCGRSAVRPFWTRRRAAAAQDRRSALPTIAGRAPMLLLVPRCDSDDRRPQSDRKLVCGRRRAYAPNATGRAEWRFCCSSAARPTRRLADARLRRERMGEPRARNDRGGVRAVAVARRCVGLLVAACASGRDVRGPPHRSRVPRWVQRTQSWSSRTPHCGLRCTPPTRRETRSIAFGLKSGTMAA
jgi:hypothetical protein